MAARPCRATALCLMVALGGLAACDEKSPPKPPAPKLQSPKLQWISDQDLVVVPLRAASAPVNLL